MLLKAQAYIKTEKFEMLSSIKAELNSIDAYKKNFSHSMSSKVLRSE